MEIANLKMLPRYWRDSGWHPISHVECRASGEGVAKARDNGVTPVFDWTSAAREMGCKP